MDFDLYTRTPDGYVMYYYSGSWDGLGWGGDSWPICNSGASLPETVSGVSSTAGTYDFWYNIYSGCSSGSVFQNDVTITAIDRTVVNGEVLEPGDSRTFSIAFNGCTGACTGGTGTTITITPCTQATQEQDCKDPIDVSAFGSTTQFDDNPCTDNICDESDPYNPVCTNPAKADAPYEDKADWEHCCTTIIIDRSLDSQGKS
ncbi:MAG: hypothetical protein NTW59_01790, partial [Candidatus Diapherotrites archaeon]|nr:hypothetical protein [Candidatus Diapherotrites archaeon]